MGQIETNRGVVGWGKKIFGAFGAVNTKFLDYGLWKVGGGSLDSSNFLYWGGLWVVSGGGVTFETSAHG